MTGRPAAGRIGACVSLLLTVAGWQFAARKEQERLAILLYGGLGAVMSSEPNRKTTVLRSDKRYRG